MWARPVTIRTDKYRQRRWFFKQPRPRGGVGPEISVAFPKPMFFVSFRYIYEFMAENRAQGQTSR